MAEIQSLQFYRQLLTGDYAMDELQDHMKLRHHETQDYRWGHETLYLITLDGITTGHARVRYIPHDDELSWIQHYPVEECEQLKGKGIGALSTIDIIFDQMHLHGISLSNGTSVSHDTANTSRKRHLRRMGITHTSTPLAPYVLELLEYGKQKGFYLPSFNQVKAMSFPHHEWPNPIFQ